MTKKKSFHTLKVASLESDLEASFHLCKDTRLCNFVLATELLIGKPGVEPTDPGSFTSIFHKVKGPMVKGSMASKLPDGPQKESPHRSMVRVS